jgi:hypothetical protein
MLCADSFRAFQSQTHGVQIQAQTLIMLKISTASSHHAHVNREEGETSTINQSCINYAKNIYTVLLLCFSRCAALFHALNKTEDECSTEYPP